MPNMTYARSEFMPLDRQLFARDIASALAEFARQKYPTAKHLARAWGVALITAQNVLKGHLSVTVLAKAIAAEGGDLWDAIGREITGETYEQRQERKLQKALQEADHAHSNLVQLRARREALEALVMGSGSPGAGSLAEQSRDRSGGPWGRADGSSDRGPRTGEERA